MTNDKCNGAPGLMRVSSAIRHSAIQNPQSKIENEQKPSIVSMARPLLTDPTETRTPVAGMKTRCPRPLDDGAD